MEDNHPMKNVSPDILSLLSSLHARSIAEESQLSPADFAPETIDEKMQTKFIALDQDKCHFIYQLALSINAKTIVEAGTSYGVSTIYLALAVASNIATSGGPGKVIGTEHETAKAAQAREYWNKCGSTVHNLIELREGDLRETLKIDLETIDMLLLDSEFGLCSEFDSCSRGSFTNFIVMGSLDSPGTPDFKVGPASSEIRCRGHYRQHCGIRCKIRGSLGVSPLPGEWIPEYHPSL